MHNVSDSDDNTFAENKRMYPASSVAQKVVSVNALHRGAREISIAQDDHANRRSGRPLINQRIRIVTTKIDRKLEEIDENRGVIQPDVFP